MVQGDEPLKQDKDAAGAQYGGRAGERAQGINKRS